MDAAKNNLYIGWAEADITPEKSAFLAGHFNARVSEGVRDPIKAIALALQSGDNQAILVCCDLVAISDQLRDSVREKVQNFIPEINVSKIILNATHTHTAPENRPPTPENGGISSGGNGVELDAISPAEFIEFAAPRIADAVVKAWNSRARGGISYGLGFAVLGRSRRWVNRDGVARMFGLEGDAVETFEYIEGYEDHSVNLLATYDDNDQLTGIVFNAPLTAQETGNAYLISADMWHEARRELRKRFGQNIHILTQVSAAGELVPRRLYGKAAHNRMLQLTKRTEREEYTHRIVRAVEDILPHLSQAIERDPVFEHQVGTVDLPLNKLTKADAENAEREVAENLGKYRAELKKLEENPQLKHEKRWYVPITRYFRTANWHKGVVARYKRQEIQPTQSAEIHIIRLGNIAIATNPFEYYVDFGVQIKLRSPAVQTFIVELAGAGTYVPSFRSVRGGGYGSMPASNPIGPEGGQILADKTVELIEQLF